MIYIKPHIGRRVCHIAICTLVLGSTACQNAEDPERVAGGMISAGDLAGALPAGEQSAGGLAGEQVAGQQVAGQQVAGQQVAGEQVAGQQVAGEQPTGTSPRPPMNPVDACADFGATECFANNECELDARCQDVGAPGLPVSCCVQGIRGAGMTGDPCSEADGQLTCASSICVMFEGESNGFCSGECLDDSECPASMPRCIPIAFSGNDSMWCFPPEGE